MSYEQTNELLWKNPTMTASEACDKTGFSKKQFYAKRAYALRTGDKVPPLRTPGNAKFATPVGKIKRVPTPKMFEVQAAPVRTQNRVAVVIGEISDVQDVLKGLWK